MAERHVGAADVIVLKPDRHYYYPRGSETESINIFINPFPSRIP